MPAPRTEADPQTRRDAMPLAGVQCQVRDFRRADPQVTGEAALTSFDLDFSAGAAVRRYDWWRERYYDEVLEVSQRAVRLDRMRRGVSLLDSHNSWTLRSVLGVCDRPSIADGRASCHASLSRREEVAPYAQDIADGVVRHVSVGYVRHRVEMEPPNAPDGVWTYRVVDWEPMEVSLVPIPADMDAGIRAADGGLQDAQGREVPSYPCDFVEPITTRAAAQPQENHAMTEAERAAAEAQRQADEAARAAAAEAQRLAAEQAARAAEQQRSADITEMCARHGVAQLAAGLIRAGNSIDQARAAVLEELARRDAAAGGHRNTVVQTMTDEGRTLRSGIEEALMHRVHAGAQLTDNGRQFRGMSLLEIGRDFLERHHVNTRGMSRMDLAQAFLQFRSPGMLGTSDFANLLANVANKRLRMGYEQARATYSRWARRAPNAPDFKSMKVVQLSGAPDLKQVNEHGEFTYGAMSDTGETYAVSTYGRIVSMTRQAIVNDDLRGFDRLITAFGDSAARLENRTVYGILTANANLADGGALFNATAVTTAGGHANLAGAAAAIALGPLNLGRTAMRLQKGLQNEELNIAPRFLIVPATQEMVAYQYTSANYVPANQSGISDFAAGGRSALEVVVEAYLDSNSTTAWYLAADPASVDTVEYCFLDGSEGPVIESEVGFEVDGVSYKCREDFAAKAIDFRGLYKNAGA